MGSGSAASRLPCGACSARPAGTAVRSQGQSCSLHIIYCVRNNDSMRELPFSYLSAPTACCSWPVMSHSARLGFTMKKGEAEYEL